MKPYTIQINAGGHATIYDNDSDAVICRFDTEDDAVEYMDVELGLYGEYDIRYEQ